MALLSHTSLQLGRSAAAGLRSLVPTVQHTVRRRHSTGINAANPDGAYVAPEYPADQGALPSDVLFFAGWGVYKAKGAVRITPRKADWEQNVKGNYILARAGTFRFETAAAAAGSGSAPGERRYNWDQKIIIDLSAAELGAILAKPEKEHEFYHDSYKGQAGREGTVIKTFKWSAAEDGNSYYINTTLRDKNANTSYSCSVSFTSGEFFVLKELGRFCMPYLLGWAEIIGR